MSDIESTLSVGEYIREGTMVALPLCFPSQTLPPPAGETAARVMEIDSSGTVYLGTRGAHGHVLAGLLRQDTGIVFDAGIVPEATSVEALAILDRHIYVVACGPGGTALWRTGRISGSFMVQEWGMTRPVFERVGTLPLAGVSGSVSAPDGTSIFLVEAQSGAIVHVETTSARVLGRYDSGGGDRFGHAISLDTEGRVWGTAGKAGLWVLSPARGILERLPLTVPCSAGREQHSQVSAWALDGITGTLYGGTAPDGFLFMLDPRTRQIVSLGKPARQEPVACLTVGNDGCVIGMAGGDDDIAHVFRYDPRSRSLVDLGLPISTLSTRQYGYVYSCARTGRDGEMYFGQCERVNHLWMYYPPVPRRVLETSSTG